MPTLDWIGKKAVVNHHREVPYHLLKCDGKLSVGAAGSGNLLVQGDNLAALKALLPYYAGRVKCIYIDPPYNTGNENWVYNDAVNSPEIRKWLGKVVGAEAEDLSRHDKWLCMMYPRLMVLREFLRSDGTIFISIADHEVHNLRHVMDEIFGPRNFVAAVIWQKVFSPKNTAKHFSEDHDYIIVYAKNADAWHPNLVMRTARQDNLYKNPDNDPRGPWTSSDLSARNPYSVGLYAVTCPSGRVISGPTKGRYWVVAEEKFKELDKDNRVWWGSKGDNMPRLKRFLSEVKTGIVPQTLWAHEDVGHTQEAKRELLTAVDFADTPSVFITPKPTRLVKRILEIAADRNSLVLDSFAGSGTTGHAVLDLNKADGGNRRFILVEMEEEICQNVTAQRLTRAIQGHNDLPALGGGFRYCRLGPTIFDETGNIRAGVTFGQLAAHVYFTETGEPLPKRPSPHPSPLAKAEGKKPSPRPSPGGRGEKKWSPLLGVHNGKAIYVLFNGILGDRSPRGGNVLTGAVLSALPAPPSPPAPLPKGEGGMTRIIYGEGTRLGKARLKREGIVFKQIPYGVKVS